MTVLVVIEIQHDAPVVKRHFVRHITINLGYLPVDKYGSEFFLQKGDNYAYLAFCGIINTVTQVGSNQ